MDAASISALTRRSPGWIPRRPALLAVLCLIAGICLAFELPTRPLVCLGIAACSAMLAMSLRRQAVVATLLISTALIALGASIAQEKFYRYGVNDINLFSSAEPRLTQLELRLDDPPHLVSSSAGGRQLPPKQMVIATVTRIDTRNGWIVADGEILMQITHPHPFLTAGQSVRVLGMLGRPAHATNPGEFDEADHYRLQRVLTSIRVERTANIQILSADGAGVFGWMRAQARDLLAAGFSDKQATDHALLRALVLGDSDPLIHDSQQQLRNIGVAYLLSISGMHIAIVVAVVYGFCRLAMFSPRFSGVLCVAIVILYGVVALPSQTALRAVLLCSAILLGILSGRTTDKLQLLAVVAGMLLVDKPMDLFSAGFQLGLVCVLGLILIGRPLLQWLSEHVLKEDALSKRKAAWIWRRIWLTVCAWLAISLIAWIVSLPLVAYQFGQISPLAIPCGILLFPVVTAALIGGCAKILLTLALPSLAVMWAHLAIVPIHAMEHFAAKLAHLPGAAIAVPQPSISGVAVYYIFLSLPLFPWPRRWLRRASSGLAAGAVCCLLATLSLGFTTTALPKDAGGVSIAFLDIGAGQCAVLQAPGAAPILIDAGSSTVSDVVRTCLGPYLRLHGDRHISSVFLSHSDYDHISAIPAALPAFGIGTVFTSHYFEHFASIDPPAQALLDQLNRASRSPHLLERGDHEQLTRDVAVDVLWPPPDCNFNCNNTGLVLRLSYAGRTVLFPADIQADAMRELLKSPRQLKADVLIAAHHGSSEVTTSAFVSAVDPKFIISSNASPLTEKQKRFEQMIGNRPLYRTSNCGAITLHIGPDGSIHVQSFNRGSS